ncbi:hypothetical protein [Massilia sp.]|uniref:hypothetical protein n=1 Tax=Massilia sp. TaxID=1882437 RepID=UPI0028A28D0E|nr:hypothetical protein [Massilia sp.]
MRTIPYFSNERFIDKICLGGPIADRQTFNPNHKANNMKNILLPALLLSLVAGCASTNPAGVDAPVRDRVLAELEQAKADGSYPITEAHYANLPAPRNVPAAARVAGAGPAAGNGANDAAAAP